MSGNNEGAWKKTNRMKERRSFATGHPIAKKKRDADHIAKVPLAKPRAYIEEAEVNGDDASFDPVQRDPFFAVLAVSQHWPPSAETIQRLLASTVGCGMSMYDREGADDAKKAKKNKTEVVPVKKGIPKAPPGMDISKRRKTIVDSDEEN